jgi:hypothetical protein
MDGRLQGWSVEAVKRWRGGIKKGEVGIGFRTLTF